MDMIKKYYVITGFVIVIIVAIVLGAKAVKAPEGAVPAKADTAEQDVVQTPPESGSVVKEVGTGKEFISNQLIVEFDVDVSEEQALLIIEQTGGKMLARFTEAPLFLVQVEDTEDGSGAIGVRDKLNKVTGVKKAELNYLTAGTVAPESVNPAL